MKRETIVSLGLAMFTMLFGAGNIVFPLMLGKNCGSQVWLALIGFGLTAVALPVLGFVATVMCDGDFSRLLGYLGKIPGTAMVFLIMLLIGPLCAIPRCIILSYGTFKSLIPSINMFVFSLCSSGVIFVCAYRPSFIVKAFGRFFGPLKLSLIGFLVFKCFTMPDAVSTATVAFPLIEGIVGGYETMDLLAALVITGLMAISMPWIVYGSNQVALRGIVKKSIMIGCVGGLALSLVYAGFAFSAARFSVVLQGVRSDELLTVLATHVLGGYGHWVAGIIVLVTCLTTAMVLSAAVARYFEHAFRGVGLSYGRYLMFTCLLAGIMSLVGFDGLMHVVEPVVLIVYPIVILLALAVIVLKLWVPAKSSTERGAVDKFFGGTAHHNVIERVAALQKPVVRDEHRT
jgi:LIVCS family branched-chain amino acid:cation transporter